MPQGPPFEWDPSNPSCLLLPFISKDGSLETTKHFVVSDGTCADDHELTALLQILSDHEEYHQVHQHDETSRNQSSKWKELSRRYRKAVKEALDFVEDTDTAMTLDEEDRDKKGDSPPLQENYISLRSIYSSLYLSEIFIPLTSPRWEHENPYEKPGYVTAEIVRYLRQQHGDCFTLRDGSYVPDDDISLMCGSEQPDKFRGDDGKFYWEYLEFLTRIGRLEDVADLLLRHSLYATTQSTDLKRDFQFFCALLLVAPLPGGRNISNDYSFSDVAFGNEDQYPMLEEGPTISEIGVEDFKHWETGANRDVSFSSFGAVNAHRTWQDMVARTSLPTLQQYLSREISELINILTGASLHTSSTPELQLLEELLYKNPNWTPMKVAARASGLGMKPFDTKIMHGDVLEALEQLFLGGSSSGAALPSTLHALLVSLYSDAEVLPEDWDDLGPAKTEILCNAAFDIITSLSENNADIGAQQGIRLLSPYVFKEGKREYIASIASILSHHKPSTVDYARTIIALCEPLIDLKCVEVLEGCTDVILYIFREAIAQADYNIAAYIVSRGLNLESRIYSNPNHGSCFKAWCARCRLVCARLCKSLLENISTESSDNPDEEASEYLAAFHDPSINIDLLNYPMITQLECIYALFEVVRDKATPDVVAERVAECLDGPGSSVLTPALREDILLILKKEIDDKNKRKMLGVKVEPGPRKPLKLTWWAEQSLTKQNEGYLDFERLCLDEFVENVFATNAERAKSASRNSFGSTTNMKHDDSRPFTTLTEREKRTRVEYLNRRIDMKKPNLQQG